MRRISQLLFFAALLLGGYVAGSATDGGRELLAAGSAFRGAWASLASPEKRGYAEKYRHLGQPVDLIGVEFSKAERNIAAFEVGLS